jgi:hypothetical protein
MRAEPQNGYRHPTSERRSCAQVMWNSHVSSSDTDGLRDDECSRGRSSFGPLTLASADTGRARSRRPRQFSAASTRGASATVHGWRRIPQWHFDRCRPDSWIVHELTSVRLLGPPLLGAHEVNAQWRVPGIADHFAHRPAHVEIHLPVVGDLTVRAHGEYGASRTEGQDLYARSELLQNVKIALIRAPSRLLVATGSVPNAIGAVRSTRRCGFAL